MGKIQNYNNIKINTNQFSLIFSFKIKEIKDEEDIIIINLIKEKTSLFQIIINKQKNLVVSSKEAKLNTNIIIEKEIFYFLCININQKNKSFKIYINNEKTSKENILMEKIFPSCFCYNYSSNSFKFPTFSENINVVLGDINFYGILGEILLINIELDAKSVEHLFNSRGRYGNIIYKNKFKNNLILNKISYTKKYSDAISHFKDLQYECLLKIIEKPSYFKKYNNDLFEYNIKSTVQEFLNEKGIEFLIFMLHTINSQIKDYQTFDLYIHKTVDFLYK